VPTCPLKKFPPVLHRPLHLYSQVRGQEGEAIKSYWCQAGVLGISQNPTFNYVSEEQNLLMI